MMRQRTAISQALPAPVGGLNARDALAAMPPTDASVMLNWFPHQDRVVSRAGYSALATSSDVGSAKQGFRRVAAYGSTLFAALWFDEDVASTNYERVIIYSVDLSTGALTNVREIIAMGTASTNRIYAIGEPVLFVAASGTKYLIWPMVTITALSAISTTFHAYDGSSWSSLSITGGPTTLNRSHVHRNRLWFFLAQGPTLKAYYLPPGSASGALTTFDVSPYASKGGCLLAMRTWTRDNGEGGSDDLLAFITSEGQAIVYQGTDPSSASTWGLVGVYELGRISSMGRTIFGVATDPYGLNVRDSFAFKYGADVLVNTERGITSLGRTVSQEQTDYGISDKIRALLATEANVWSGNRTTAEELANTPVAHAQFSVLPSLNQLIFNVPQSYSSAGSPSVTTWVSVQYVMNTQTGAWTKWSGMSMIDSVMLDGVLYFIDGSMKVYKYDGTAASDNGTAITFEARQAYNYLGSPDNKLFTLLRPNLRSTGNFSVTARGDVDFNGETISTYTSYTVASEQNVAPWTSPSRYGRAIAPHIKGQTSAGVVSWYSTDVVGVPGGVL